MTRYGVALRSTQNYLRWSSNQTDRPADLIVANLPSLDKAPRHQCEPLRLSSESCIFSWKLRLLRRALETPISVETGVPRPRRAIPSVGSLSGSFSLPCFVSLGSHTRHVSGRSGNFISTWLLQVISRRVGPSVNQLQKIPPTRLYEKSHVDADFRGSEVRHL